MKFELKTEKENYSKSISQFFGIFFFLTLIIILCDAALKLGIISKNHKIESKLPNTPSKANTAVTCIACFAKSGLL